MKDSAQRSGRSPDWLKMQNSSAFAVKREAEEEWGKKEMENNELGPPRAFLLDLQSGGCLGPLQTDVEPPSKAQEPLCRCFIGYRGAALLVIIEGDFRLPTLWCERLFRRLPSIH
jgi:hypothetical protein